MIIIWIFGIGFIFVFGISVFYGAPFLPTKKREIIKALKMLALKKGDVFLELGCGDGRVIKQALHHEVKIIGVEVSPVWYLFCKIRFYKNKNVSIKFGNFLKNIDFNKVDAIYVFGVSAIMSKLGDKFNQTKNIKLRLVSNSYEFPNFSEVDKQSSLVLYEIDTTVNI